jgi:hypothetical protein
VKLPTTAINTSLSKFWLWEQSKMYMNSASLKIVLIFSLSFGLSHTQDKKGMGEGMRI